MDRGPLQGKRALKSYLHRFARYLGFAFTLLSFFYLTYVLWERWEQIISQPGTTKLVAVVAPCGLIYGLLCSLLAFAWHHMLSMVDHSASFSKTYPIYARSQIGKYLPGNVFHYAGRQLMGKAAGLGHSVLLTATTFETLLIVTASIGITAAGVPLLSMGQPTKNMILAVGILAIICIFLSIWLSRPLSLKFPLLSKYLGNLPSFRFRDWVSFMLTPLATYVAFFLLFGTLISAAASVSFGLEFSIENIAIFCTLYAVSWTLGFITPGCPGGLGIREGVLTAGLMQVMDGPNAISLAFGLRAVTIIGDGLFYFTSHIDLSKVMLRSR